MQPMNAVLDYLKQNQKRAVTELCDYVRFPSVSAQPAHANDMQLCARWLADHCRRLGLTVEIVPTRGHPVVLAKTPRAKSAKKRKHFVVYGHYDVQPPEPFELWDSPPFKPVIKDGKLFARGSSDNKGQNLAHLKAVEAYLKTGTPLPCDLTFMIEGEEEVGSKSLPEFLKARRKELLCDAVVVSDTGMPAKGLPALTYGLRGICALEITLHGPSRDLHSGIFGGSVENPAMALCQLLAQLRDRHGRITVPGFYDDVKPLSAYERKQMARLPYNERAYRKLLGVGALFGERGYTATEQRSARPTLEINGLTSGYQGEGSKTIVPSWARVKITMRLVPDQDPERILRLVQKQLRKLCPPSVRLEIKAGHGARPYAVSPSGPQAQAALRALKQAFKAEPVLLREGGSIPIVNQFKRILGADTLLLGLALPDDNAHSPNEKFELDCFTKGQLMAAHLWPELAAIR
jgi:acetylornithine deacetylase/succinyl-diaminopimelate desuccinylase-like protein